MKSVTKGEFGGIGAEMKMVQGVLKVVSIYNQGSAYIAGIKVNDIIMSIDSIPVAEMTMLQIQDKLRGTPGTKVKIVIFRDNIGSYELTVTRDMIKIIPVKVDIFCDSKYVIQGITSWIKSWKQNSWKSSTKKPVKNIALWQTLDNLNTELNCQIVWQWVKAHDGNTYNEMVDNLARAAANKKTISNV